MTTIPIWLLDVDGVLNAVHPKKEIWSDWKHGYACAGLSQFEYPIWYSQTVIDAITELYGSGQVEVCWLTTWGKDANDSLRDLLGLPILPVAAEPPAIQGRLGWWKLNAATKVANPARPLIWTDDDLKDEPDAMAWARSFDSLLISPKTNEGLTAAHLELIRAFVAGERPGVRV